MNMYVISRQTTESGTATDVVKVTGRDSEEAKLNAKIKAYELMKTFKNEKTMIDAFVGISDLSSENFETTEKWERAVEPQTAE